jgi:SAM-dependent methyltransferase
MKNFWNERYSEKDYAYGEEPNLFFAEHISELIPGKMILPAEGEGRNAVFAASLGWNVSAFDTSDEGKAKAMLLADKKGVIIDYTVDNAVSIFYPDNGVDVVAFIFAHFPPSVRKEIHQKAIQWLKPGGKIILEAFNPKQLNNLSGGPKDISMLYSEDMIRNDFENLDIEILQLTRTILNEGKYHEGIADVLQFSGTKKDLTVY